MQVSQPDMIQNAPNRGAQMNQQAESSAPNAIGTGAGIGSAVGSGLSIAGRIMSAIVPPVGAALTTAGKVVSAASSVAGGVASVVKGDPAGGQAISQGADQMIGGIQKLVQQLNPQQPNVPGQLPSYDVAPRNGLPGYTVQNPNIMNNPAPLPAPNTSFSTAMDFAGNPV